MVDGVLVGADFGGRLDGLGGFAVIGAVALEQRIAQQFGLDEER